MTTLTMRQTLITYLADADDNKVNDVYKFLENDLKSEKSFKLTAEQLKWLNEQHELHLAGKTKSYTREEALNNKTKREGY